MNSSRILKLSLTSEYRSENKIKIQGTLQTLSNITSNLGSKKENGLKLLDVTQVLCSHGLYVHCNALCSFTAKLKSKTAKKKEEDKQTILKSTSTRKLCSIAFIWMTRQKGFIQALTEKVKSIFGLFVNLKHIYGK